MGGPGRAPDRQWAQGLRRAWRESSTSVQSHGLLKTWIVLPTFNEAGNVMAVLDAIWSADSRLEVLVVDDDSPDGTGALVEARSAQEPRVRALRRRGERGLGTAYRAGFREALRCGAEAVVTMDCDFSHDPAEIPALLAALDGGDVVIGSRYTAGGRIVGWSLHRRLLSASANRFVHLLFRLPASDCTSGFRAYRRHVLEAIPWERIESTGYSFLVESLLWAARQGGARIREIPICFRDRHEGASKLGWREVAHGARNLLRVWRRPSS
jgi:dolichol-phosphate mannosyltransferase